MQDPEQQDQPDSPQPATITSSSAASIKPWDPRPDEPSLWYSRFGIYLRLGVSRSIEKCHRDCSEVEGRPLDEKKRSTRPGANWYQVAREWEWEERAKAWDAEQREILAASDRERRFDGRERRLALVDEYLTGAAFVLAAANLTKVDQEEARAWLPFMRLFFKDLVLLHRGELELFARENAEANADRPAITADDLRQAQRELDEWQAEMGLSPNATVAVAVPAANPVAATPAAAATPAGTVPDKTPAPSGTSKTGRTLLVCIGSDTALMVDLAALRAVRAATNLQFRRLIDATRDDFEAHLRRERSKGRPVELLHLALHADHEGVAFADGTADGNWLSERLCGVRVLLLAGCQGDWVGDWLGVVPHVITLSEEISHADAALLTEHFWKGIGHGLDADAALDTALAACPPVVGEYVVRHW
ncbi:MAG: hypothetical protein U0X20_00220 [Caldilineaceae bacterium]